MLRKVSIGIAVVIGLIMIYLLTWPVPIDPAPWTPPEAPGLTGIYEVNDYLASIERLEEGIGFAPDDIAFDASGRLYTGLMDGRIMRFVPDKGESELFADTGGHLHGLHFDAYGNLIVCDSENGLLQVAPDGTITVLSTEEGGVPYGFINDVDIAEDGTIYFTDSTSKFSMEDYVLDILEHRPNGRLLAYNPTDGSTRLALGDIYFTDGVAISPDQSFVLVAETGKYRIKRLWLSGPKAGETDIFIDNLPGFIDGVASNGRDIFWVALLLPRDTLVDNLLLPRPFLRKVVVRLPEFLHPIPEDYGFVLGLDIKGNVIHNLQDPSGAYAQICSITEHDGMLYLGSFAEDSIGRVPVPK